MKIKNWIALSLSLLLVLSACGKKNAPANMSSEEMSSETSQKTMEQESDTAKKRLKIVTTVFPAYDWVREILGERANQVDLVLLQKDGVDLHSYQPSVEDLRQIAECDLFVYVGGESDRWAADAVANEGNENRIAMNLVDVIGDDAKVEEMVEGMQEEEKHDHDDHDDPAAHADHDHDEHAHEAHGEEPEIDEHVWLSLDNAEELVEEIAKAMAKIDPQGADIYQANAKAYEEKLENLDDRYEKMVETAPLNTVLFGDRFPFRYLVDDYDLKYYAAFVGCSAETEASFETVTFLANKVDELQLPAVLTIEKSDQKIAKTIVENTKSKDQKILTLHSMQSVTKADQEAGMTYLSLSEKNLETLKEALHR